ncbi:MAG TPA: gliding motility protein GldM [Chitinophagales bacterium]|nr:gliding motility protein GldM [Chitinophagales bacterium]
MAIPKENRQQMINMMYIVLTAMLALNVSAELLNAFSLINKSLVKSSETLDKRTAGIYSTFAEKRVKENANERLKLYESKALKVKTISEDVQQYIDQTINDLIEQGGGPAEEFGGDMKKRDDVDLSTRLLVEGTEKGNVTGGRGYVLQKKLEDALSQLIGLADTADVEIITKNWPFNTEITNGQVKILANQAPTKANERNPIANPANDWVRESFAQIPAIASQTMLTKFKSDMKGIEADMSAYMLAKVGQAEQLKEDEIVFDKFQAKIVAPTSYVMLGETFEAEIFLAAFNSRTNNVSISVNGGSLPVNSDGVGTFKRAASSVGEFQLNGSISVKNERTGTSNSYKLPEYKYTVAAPFATVSPTKMNVFYIGVENPIEVSAAGVRAQDLGVTISGGSISGSGGNYVVNVSTAGKASVNVAAKGKTITSREFRVKMIPDPVASVGGKKGGRMNAAEMRVQNGLSAVLENFDFDARFEVLSYQVTFVPKRQDPVSAVCNGAYFNSQVQSFQKEMKPGDSVYFEEIRVKGPDGKTRPIPGIVFTLI